MTTRPPAGAVAPDADLDLAVLVGTLSSAPTATELASGSVLLRYQVTVRLDGRTESVPVSWFDPPKAPVLGAGDRVVVVGEVRRRFYRAGGATRSATEIVADRVTKPSARSRASVAQRALQRLRTLDAAVGG